MKRTSEEWEGKEVQVKPFTQNYFLGLKKKMCKCFTVFQKGGGQHNTLPSASSKPLKCFSGQFFFTETEVGTEGTLE